MGEAVVLWIPDEEDDHHHHHHLPSGSGSSGGVSMAYCRICHETGFESFKSLEAPCSCSGTVKYAHRDCIQRWCDEKGNTICEICLQNYEPGYTAAKVSSSKKDDELLEALTIRDSLEIGNEEGMVAQVGVRHMAGEYSVCTTAADRIVGVCRSLVLTFTFLLLLRHSFETLVTGTEEDYPFTITTILILRASGIIIPMYIIVRTIASLQKSIRRRYQGCDEADQIEDGRGFSDEEVVAEEEEQLHLV
ncbi:unnamed protein product [Linum tenue]|uniref:RING-CH-type domain-containing protein n=1 Tax=Linum tenue TaxID=586396 RepID=A0AAV0PFI0_9ROSI|nr:unnamed protein product [Linum tenue]